jgi:hypothetical protein
MSRRSDKFTVLITTIAAIGLWQGIVGSVAFAQTRLFRDRTSRVPIRAMMPQSVHANHDSRICRPMCYVTKAGSRRPRGTSTKACRSVNRADAGLKRQHRCAQAK